MGLDPSGQAPERPRELSQGGTSPALARSQRWWHRRDGSGHMWLARRPPRPRADVPHWAVPRAMWAPSPNRG